MDEESIQNEQKAIHALCWDKSHPNLVTIFRQGSLINSNYYYIDMELCDLNLKDFIRGNWHCSLSDFSPFFNADISEWTRMIDVWKIMAHITSAIEFIHGLGFVHRDIKPDNGTKPFEVELICSPLFLERRGLEGG